MPFKENYDILVGTNEKVFLHLYFIAQKEEEEEEEEEERQKRKKKKNSNKSLRNLCSVTLQVVGWLFTSDYTIIIVSCYEVQKQPPRGVPRKRCSENMQQIYRRTPMPKCDFNKVAKQLY